MLTPFYLVGRARILGWFLLLVVAILFVGLRSEVGGDWNNYLELFHRSRAEDFSFVYKSVNPGYVLLNWISGRVGLGVYGVNTICALFFLGGLAYFCNRQPLPLLAWLAATPYLIIVVGMGYTRQSVAVGLLMAALTFLEDRRIKWFLILLGLAATFHKSAILLLPFVLTVINRQVIGRVWKGFHQGVSSAKVLGAGLTIIALLFLFAVDKFDVFYSEFRAYILLDSWHSEGGLVRALMNGTAAIFFLIFHRRLSTSSNSGVLWYWVAASAIIVVIVTPFFSTFADRMGLYLIGIQIYVVTRVPMLVRDEKLKGLVVVGLCGLYALVLFVWLNYANHAYYWVPYKTVLML